MTGSLLLHRQHSSAADYSSIDKMTRSKLRRWSSAENHNTIEITSDNDSGIEDFDQQVINLVPSQSNNIDDDEPSTQFGACDDEYFEINQTLNISEQLIYQQSLDLYNDVCLTENIPDSEKKNICSNTCEIFHGEFARDIIYPLAINYPDVRYYLFSENEVHSDPFKWPGFAFVKLDNAKAQFKCPNISCNRLWTSMRARISFKISRPQSNGFVVLKIFGQICQQCETLADPLWYTEEVCRVMKNLTQSIFNEFFPEMIHYNELQGTKVIQNMNRITQRPRHDPTQRIGKMRAPHDKFHCVACQHGLCFS